MCQLIWWSRQGLSHILLEGTFVNIDAIWNWIDEYIWNTSI